jgi:hypothetical protein
VESNAPFGAYYHLGALRWALFNQDTTLAMPIGSGYSLVTPAIGDGLFLHQVAASAPASPDTVLNDAAVNSRPSSVIVTTSNWNPGGAAFGVYNNHNTALAYGADSRWRIRNGDGASFTAGSAFNVYASPPSPSAFRHIARTTNIRPAFPGAETLIDNPRLDNTPCAELMVTPLTTFGNRRFDVYFDGATQRWSIYSPNGMPEGAEFNVVFSPRQVFECMGSAP